jgi:uncharacterized protein
MKKLIILIFLLFFSVHIFSQDSSKLFVLGVIDEIQSVQLNQKRILNIYLPEGYSKNDTVKYPVIYLLDGSADEDFIHVAGLVQFNSFPWVNRLPKSIVVGIANINRQHDFTFPTSIETDKKNYPATGGSEKFIEFIEKELQPFIEKKYKTNSSKTIIGESLGGLLAAEILFKQPSLFNKYIIISPSLWWDDGSLLNLSSVILQNNVAQKTVIYIGVGEEGLTPGTKPHVMKTDANLLAEKISNLKNKNISLYFDYLPHETHATIGHQALLNAFVFFSKKE